MTPRLSFLVLLGVLAGAWPAGATCGWFGSQLECDLGTRQMVIGTQVADDPSHAGTSLRPQSFHASSTLLRGRPEPAEPFVLGLQNIGTDPSLCRKIGNETYCY